MGDKYLNQISISNKWRIPGPNWYDGSWAPNAEEDWKKVKAILKETNRKYKETTSRNRYMLLMLLVFCSTIVQAQDYPTKPVTLVIPMGAGGSHDLTARAVTSVAVDYLSQPIIIQLKPGGGEAIGSEAVAKAPPGGRNQRHYHAKCDAAFFVRMGTIKIFLGKGKKEYNVPEKPYRLFPEGRDSWYRST